MPRRYPVEFRSKVLNLIEAGKSLCSSGSRPRRFTTGGTRIRSIVGSLQVRGTR